MERIIDVDLAGGRAYPIRIAPGCRPQIGALIAERLGARPALVIADATVAGLYAEELLASLAVAGISARLATFPAGEPSKHIDTCQQLWQACADAGLDRGGMVIAFGGGVSGDIAGFIAATWMRGLPLVQIPTSLLAMVDSAVGGKTGVNLAAGKNLVGAFHAPSAVVVDVDTLATLDDREYRAGLAEVVKYGAIRDAAFFAWLEQEADALAARLPDALLEAVQRSVSNKAEVVAADEREAGERALLNFGHTFGHALETATDYRRYRHGEAVAIGMSLAARLSELLSLTIPGVAARLDALLQRLGLETQLAPGQDREQLLSLMRLDKKNQAEQIRLVLLEGIGRAVVRPCEPDEIREVFKEP